MQLSGSNGKPAVQPRLESNPANCNRYTGSSAVLTRPRTRHPRCAGDQLYRAGSPGGRRLSGVVRRCVARGRPGRCVLFGNANGPGNPKVQAVLKALPDGPANLARDIDSTVTADPRW